MAEIAAFIDRDGTISEEVGYVNHISRFRLFPWASESIRNLNQHGLRTIVVSNQAGVARGYFSEDLVVEIHSKLNQDMQKDGAHLDAVYYCPHHPSAGKLPYRKVCGCRKPKPGMLLRATEEFGVDIQQSFVIGDRYSDIELADHSGARSIFVLSGYGRGEYEYQRNNWTVQPDWVVENLLEASHLILQVL